MKEPLRILHTVVNMNRGGAETLLMNLYRSINRNEIQFDFLTSFEGAYDKEIENLGGRIYRIPTIRQGYAAYVKALDHFFKNHTYTIIHAHMDKMSGNILERAKAAGIPVRIAHSHNTSSEGNALIRLYKWNVGKKINEAATHRFACSKEAGRWLFQDPSSYVLLSNSIQTKNFLYDPIKRHKVRTALGLTDEHTLFGHVGRLQTQKNHKFLLKSFADVYKQNRKARMILIGDGPLKENLQLLTDKLGINNAVIFAGIQENIPAFLHAIDVFCFPSLHEGMPVSVIEAQASGLPCLLSEAITKDLDIGASLCTYLPLELDLWTAAMTKKSRGKQARKNNKIKLQIKNFDVEETAKSLEKFYLGRYREEAYGKTNRIHTNV